MLFLRATALCGVGLLWCPGMTEVIVPTKEIAPGVNMPTISIGTGGLESQDARKIVVDWLGLGGRGIDTANDYKNQVDVGKAISAAGLSRKDVFITTKIPGCFNAKAKIDEDLKQLGTDYIDLLLIHFPLGPCSTAWKTIEDYHAKGYLRAIGVSNFKKSELENLLRRAKTVPAVNQIELNILSHDDDTIAFARSHNITIEAYSPLGRNGTEIPQNPVIREIAERHSVTTYQVAMKWILEHGYVLTFQSSKPTHQSADADVEGFDLSEAEMTRLDGLQAQSRGRTDGLLSIIL